MSVSLSPSSVLCQSASPPCVSLLFVLSVSVCPLSVSVCPCSVSVLSVSVCPYSVSVLSVSVCPYPVSVLSAHPLIFSLSIIVISGNASLSQTCFCLVHGHQSVHFVFLSWFVLSMSVCPSLVSVLSVTISLSTLSFSVRLSCQCQFVPTLSLFCH